MSVDVLLGLQWGDEGKGKIVDVITSNYDIVARFQGGPNAGHTLIFNGSKHVLHTIPSGIFHDNIQNLIGNGVVVDPVILAKEIENVTNFGVNCVDKLYVSRKAHLILPTHRLIDAASEKAKGKSKIGSTLKGIGPSYMDKTGRNGLRIGDIELKNFQSKYEQLVKKHKQILNFYSFEYDLNSLEEKWFNAIDVLNKLTFVDGEHFIQQAIKRGKKVLAEGAQGTLLDIDFGTYPYVTSSNTTCAGACTGLGIAPNQIRDVFGIFKAYCTRVGSGPFPTEQLNDEGKKMQEVGKEFGATTGRERRCGWIDLPALKYAVQINGVTKLIMMKADVLSGFENIKVGTGYNYKGNKIFHLPYSINNGELKPFYKDFCSWEEDIDNLDDINQIPMELDEYIKFLEKELEVPIAIVSVGPDRKQTLIKEEFF